MEFAANLTCSRIETVRLVCFDERRNCSRREQANDCDRDTGFDQRRSTGKSRAEHRSLPLLEGRRPIYLIFPRLPHGRTNSMFYL